MWQRTQILELHRDMYEFPIGFSLRIISTASDSIRYIFWWCMANCFTKWVAKKAAVSVAYIKVLNWKHFKVSCELGLHTTFCRDLCVWFTSTAFTFSRCNEVMFAKSWQNWLYHRTSAMFVVFVDPLKTIGSLVVLSTLILDDEGKMLTPD